MSLLRTAIIRLLQVIVTFVFACYPVTPLLATEPAPKAIITQNPSAENVQAEQAGYLIQDIQLVNPRLLSKRMRGKLLRPYINTYLNTDKLKRLVNDLKAFYIKQGYPTMQVKVALGQSLQANILKLIVVDGFIEEIRINQDSPRARGRLATAFPGLQDKLLYLPHLEQGINQLNAATSSHATLKILPGNHEGGSIIQVNQVVSKPFRVDAGADNLGEQDSGKWQGKMNMALDNLLSINDTWIFNYTTNKAKKIASKKFTVNSWMLYNSFPIGYYTIAATCSFKSSIMPIAPSKYAANKEVNLQITKNYMYSYELKRVIYKTKIHKNLFLAGFEYRKPTSYIRDQLIGNQSVPYAFTKMGTNHTGLCWRGQYILTLTYEQGVNWCTAKSQLQTQESDRINSLYKKVNLHLLWLRPIYLSKRVLSYQVDLTAQYTKDHLPGFAQVSIGSFSQVRGFKKHYAGNQGACAKQELSLSQLFYNLSFLRPLQFMVAIDLGYLSQVSSMDPKLGNQPLALASWVCGCRYNHPWMSMEWIYAKPAYNAKYLADTGYMVYFNLSFKLHNLLPTKNA